MARLIGARLYNSSNISIPSGTSTVLTFNTELEDDENFHSGSSGQLVVPYSGEYLIGFHCDWAGSSNGTYRRLDLRVNGSIFIATNTLPRGSSISALGQEIITRRILSAGDYVEVRASHDHTSALTISAGSEYSPIFWIQRIG